MIRGITSGLLLILAHVWTPSRALQAEITPPGREFNVFHSSWNATDIAVVRGAVVQEVWKGDLKTGDLLPLDSLRLPQEVHYGFFRGSRKPDKLPPDAIQEVSGNRLVLFLVRNANEDEPWTAAGTDFKYATVWIDGGRCLWIYQLRNSGHALLRPTDTFEPELKSKVLSICKIQARFESANRIESPSSRAKALIAMLDTIDESYRDRLYQYISDCGYPAWPVIRPLLFDEEHLPIHRDLMSLAMTIDKKAALPVLERIVQEEARYWQSLSGDTPPETFGSPPVSHHFERLTSALITLRLAGYVDDKGIVASLRRDWESSPLLRQLGSGEDGRSPILRQADRIVERKPRLIKLPMPR